MLHLHIPLDARLLCRNSENKFPKNLYWEIFESPFFLSSRQFQSISIQIPIKKYIIPSCIQLSSWRVGASLNHPFVSSPLLCEPPQSEFSLRRGIYVRAIIVIITQQRGLLGKGERKLCIRYYIGVDFYWFYCYRYHTQLSSLPCSTTLFILFIIGE